MPLPKPTQSETAEDFIDRCMDNETMKEEYPKIEQRYAVCSMIYESEAIQKNLRAETYTDYPKAASENAKRALKFRDETDNKNGCGTPVGWNRANQLAKREAISLETVKRMAAFIRHQQNKDVPYESGCGGLMWDAWGGDAGINWAINKIEQIREQTENK
jgi:hypothetical protein